VIKVVSLILWLEDHFSKKYNGTDVNRLVLLDSNGIVPGFDIGAGPSSAAVYFREFSRWLMVCRWFFFYIRISKSGRLAKLMQMVY
jgi:hypothetical protein